MSQWIVPAGREVVISQLLELDAREWHLAGWAARTHWIDARYRGAQGNHVLVRLYPNDRRVPVEHRTTERFTLALLQGQPGSLLDRLAEQIARHESAFEWKRLDPPPSEAARAVPVMDDPRELDVERAAFNLGLKPAIRQLLDPQDAPWAAAIFVQEGSAVSGVLAGLPHGNAILMVAPTLAQTRAMLDAEFVQFGLDTERALAGTRELGRSLGYPDCCVEAFVADVVLDRLSTTIDQFVDNSARRLDAAWVPRPNPRINSLLFGERLQLISFDPCHFDCPAAAALANAVFERLAESSPLATAALDRELARPVIVDPNDLRAWVELETNPAGEVHIRSITPIQPGGQDFDPTPLAVVVGQRVDEAGRLPELPGSRHRVFRFDLGSRPSRSEESGRG